VVKLSRIAPELPAVDLESALEHYRRKLGFESGCECVRATMQWGNRDFRLRDEFGNEIKFTEPLTEDEAKHAEQL